MANWTASANLQSVLQQKCERIRKPSSTVLFRRGDKAFGMFLVLSGKVSLSFGIDSPPVGRYGPGALVGLPATLTRRPYSLTATVVEDADLGFLPPETLDRLLQGNDHLLSRELLALLGEKLWEMQKITKALLDNDKPPLQKSTVA